MILNQSILTSHEKRNASARCSTQIEVFHGRSFGSVATEASKEMKLVRELWAVARIATRAAPLLRQRSVA